MVEALRPSRGGFLRPFGCGWFIREYLLGNGPFGAPAIDPNRGAPTEDIRSAYKNALLRAQAEDMVALAMEKGIELSFEEALRRIPHRLTKVRSHSFYRYFHHLKMLDWVEPTGEEEGSLLGGMPGAKVERTAEGTTIVDSLSHRAFTVYLRKEKKLLMLPGAILFKRFTTTLLNAAASAVKTEIEVMFNRSAGKRNNHAPPAGSGLRIRTFQVHGGPRSSRCTK